MEIKITLFATILLYALVISQSLFYILAMSDVLKKMEAASYIESRQLLDRKLSASLPFVYYMALLSSIALITFCVVACGKAQKIRSSPAPDQSTSSRATSLGRSNGENCGKT